MVISGETVGFIGAILGIIGYIVKLTTDYTRLKEEVKNLKEKFSSDIERQAKIAESTHPQVSHQPYKHWYPDPG